jgi:hypothetical protein
MAIFMAHWLEFDTCMAPNPDPKKDPLNVRLSGELVSLTSQANRATITFQA